MHNLLLASFGFEDHVGVLDFHFKRSENGALQIEHSYQFRSTKFELGDAMVSRVFAKWKIDGDEARWGSSGQKDVELDRNICRNLSVSNSGNGFRTLLLDERFSSAFCFLLRFLRGVFLATKTNVR